MTEPASGKQYAYVPVDGLVGCSVQSKKLGWKFSEHRSKEEGGWERPASLVLLSFWKNAKDEKYERGQSEEL